MKELKIKFGANSDQISEQLDQQGFNYQLKDAMSLQRSADSITWLFIRGILPIGQVEKAQARLFKQIQQHVNKHNKP